MATGGEGQAGYSLVKDRTVTLEHVNERPDYNSIVIYQDKIIVVDSRIKIHQLHDGKFLDMFGSDSTPRAICLMDATTICVLYNNGLLETASIKSENVSPVFTRMKSSLCLRGVFDKYHSVAKVNDNIVVVGVENYKTYWCMTSLNDGHVDTIHRICNESKWSSVTTKDNIIYISCYDAAYDDTGGDTGVYAFDILNPSQCQYEYKHQRLQIPTSIVIDKDGNILVGNYGYHDNFCIHQLTASCQPVAIWTQEIPWYLQGIFFDNGRLYVTRYGSRDITVFRHVDQGSHKESEVLESDDRKLSGIVESAIKLSQENVDNGQSSDDSDDENQGNHSDSEVSISDEGEQLVIDGTSTQKEQEIVDNGQSSVETEMSPSGPSPVDSEDDNQGNQRDSAFSISNEGEQLVIEWISTQIETKIVDNGQSSVETEMYPSGPSPDDSEDENQGNLRDSAFSISDEGKQLVIEGTSTQIEQEIVDNGQSSVESEMSLSGPSPDDYEDEKHGKYSEVPFSDEGKKLFIEGTSTHIVQKILIKQSVEENLNHAEIEMSTEGYSTEGYSIDGYSTEGYSI